MIIFDEAFNDILQKEQMDILVRFWRADQVVTRYLGSQFLGSQNRKICYMRCQQVLLVWIPES